MTMTTAMANAEMAAAWDGDEGRDWARDWEHYDRSVHHHHRALLDAAAIGPAERVLDVGCGNGQSTREAGRAASRGSALGVDLSSPMLERARQLARDQGLTNVSFLRADAQVHPFDAGAFDVAMSRFGTMFFDDPAAAFANVATALRPGGRLAIVVWRGLEANEWLQHIFAALAVGRDLPVPPPGAPGPFGLADPDRTRAVLEASGLAGIDLAPVDAPVWLGADGRGAFEFLRATGVVRGMTEGLDAGGRQRALDALRDTMLERDTGDGVWFGSGTWLITAHRPAA